MKSYKENIEFSSKYSPPLKAVAGQELKTEKPTIVNQSHVSLAYIVKPFIISGKSFHMQGKETLES